VEVGPVHAEAVGGGLVEPGDRFVSRDTLLQGSATIGYDNELCTVVFDGNDLCHVVAVLAGKGQVEVSWLWVGRNDSPFGPPHFVGVVDGGTGTFAGASGSFDATTLPDGELRVTAVLA
jgi:hypothetical protein